MQIQLPPKVHFTAIAKKNLIPLNEMRIIYDNLRTAQNMREVSITLYRSTLPAHVAKQVYVEIRKLNGLEPKPKKTKKVATLQKPEASIHEVVGDYWLKYAESALKEQVEPSLFSNNPGQWVYDACHSAEINQPRRTDYRCVIDHTTKYIIQVLYTQPLRYMATTQWMVRRAMSK